MALFGGTKESKDEKAARKQNEAEQLIISKGNQLAHNYYLDDLDDDCKRIMAEITKNFKGNTLIDIGSLLSGDDSAKLWNIQSLTNAQLQQGWITIKLLNEISQKLDILISNK